ncbi:unnamed protein product, partial [Iphiclides podalirius]
MDNKSIIESAGFYFIHNFDSGNLGHVEQVPRELIAPGVNFKTNASEIPDYEFNLWTRPDCAGTEFENGNRTWFYFGVQASELGVLVRLNLINLNKQGKMYNQGMAPVTRTLPGKPQWERIKDRPVHSTDDNTFTLSFKYRTSENPKATTFFAFTYPYSFAELQIALNTIDLKMLPLPPPQSPDDIYYCRECLIYSLEGRRVDLLTISSHHGITTEREERLKNLFPDTQERPFKFQNKKVIFISARVHPGETPSSFVFNGFLNLLLTRADPVAVQLRKSYVFKMVPFLNPDGVARGHYRTDTRGVNLNRVYLNPSLVLHPTVYASRALIRYYHFGCEKEDFYEDTTLTSRSMQNISENTEVEKVKKKKGVYKSSENLKREKPLKSANKASGTAKCSAPTKDANTMSGEALADQVYDMKLQEGAGRSERVERGAEGGGGRGERGAEGGASLLSAEVLRSCLGSSAHLSASGELRLQGGNPLAPLRDALKDSIGLLMDGASVAGDSLDGCTCNIKVGWCEECRRAANRLEISSPGVAASAPAYATLQDTEPSPEDGSVYFCTNCFKRYIPSEQSEEILIGACSTASVAVSAGNGDGPSPETPITLVDLQPPPKEKAKSAGCKQPRKKTNTQASGSHGNSAHRDLESGLFLYIDLHGHASKKGIFMYGNHFEDVESSVECMLLPRIMSLNNLHFHFSSCNFTERNMYLKDRRDGMSREGSGRVAVLKATGLVRSYTLECNYNTGRLVNVLPPPLRDCAAPPAPQHHAPHPPKYTPHIFEEVRHSRSRNLEIFKEIDPLKVGRSLGASILDLTGQHPNSRIPCSEHRTLAALREWLRTHTRTMRPQLTTCRLRPKTASPSRVPLYARARPKGADERKENAYAGARSDTERRRSPPLVAQRSGHELATSVAKYARRPEPAKATRARHLADSEPKPRTLSTKRSILAIRKPNSAKSGALKAKASRRSDDSDAPRPGLARLSKRCFARGARCRRAAASSSSEDVAAWEEVAGGTALAAHSSGAAHSHSHSHAHADPSAPAKRRSYPNPPPSHLKKIRLKTAL